MIIFITVHKNLRKTNEIVKIAIQNLQVEKIYIISSKETLITNEELIYLKNKYPNKFFFYNHNSKGIKGAWIEARKIGIQKDANFLIFENDIVPTNFFFEYAKSCFSIYKGKNKFFGLTGYSPNDKSKISDILKLNTFLIHRSSSWSFGSTPEIAKKFLRFIDVTKIDDIGKILMVNKSKIGKDIYEHYLLDQRENRYLIGYLWNAFTVSERGLWLYPSEHLVSCFGNDNFATNQPDDGVSIISKFDSIFFEDVEINYKPVENFSIIENKKLISHWNPGILKRIFMKFKKLISN